MRLLDVLAPDKFTMCTSGMFYLKNFQRFSNNFFGDQLSYIMKKVELKWNLGHWIFLIESR